MYPYNFNPNGFPIFTPPKIKTSTRLLTKQNLGAAKKFSLSSLIDTSNKAINAFNSFVPLYHEVKPMIENGKNVDGDLLAVIKTVAKTYNGLQEK